jgi:acetylornithine deacetylase
MAAPRYTPVEMLRRLVGFDTVSAHSNLALIDWVAEYLAAYGIPSTLTRDDAGGKANLFATIGPAGRGGVVLSGHTDVVPVEGQPWSSDPFTLTERDGRLYGRGAADMKGFIAIALALVPEMMARPLATPIHFAFSYDEEVGCIGARRLIAALPEGAARPRLVIVGEPTGMQIANAHKGCAVFATDIIGLEAHSSTPERGVNAISAAAEIVGFIDRLAEERRQAAPAESPFDPPYTTFNVGAISGGTAHNIVPRHCRLDWQYRMVPGEDGAAIERRLAEFVEGDLLPRLRRTAPEASVTTTMVAVVPPFRAGADSPAEALVRLLTGANASTVLSFASEAGLFQEAGLPVVICGPGSIDDAHRPDEFISLEQLEAGTKFVRRLVEWAATGV